LHLCEGASDVESRVGTFQTNAARTAGLEELAERLLEVVVLGFCFVADVGEAVGEVDVGVPCGWGVWNRDQLYLCG
jgi:hypothetical protein